MKRIAYAFTVTVVLAFAGSASADNGGPGQAPPADHPCSKVVAACKAAGFVEGGAKEGKGLWKDCVGPIRHGQTVQGVTVEPADAEACKNAPMRGRHGGPPPAK